MNFDRSSKLKNEALQRRTVAVAKQKKEKESSLKAKILHETQARIVQERNVVRLQQAEKEEEKEKAMLVKSAGIEFQLDLLPYATCVSGDAIHLPPSALATLAPQNAIAKGRPLTFHLSTTDKSTHAGVFEFTAPEGKIGLSPIVAKALGFPEKKKVISVRYVQLPPGSLATFKPIGKGFGNREFDIKAALERSLKVRIYIN